MLAATADIVSIGLLCGYMGEVELLECAYFMKEDSYKDMKLIEKI